MLGSYQHPQHCGVLSSHVALLVLQVAFYWFLVPYIQDVGNQVCPETNQEAHYSADFLGCTPQVTCVVGASDKEEGELMAYVALMDEHC